MKYFTPQLFQQFNSPDDEVASRADADWDKAEIAYKEHLETFRDRLPSQSLSEKLHDRRFWHASYPGVCEASNHESGHGPVDHRFARLRSSLVVFAQPPIASDPTKGPFDHPAARQELNPLTSSVRLTICNTQEQTDFTHPTSLPA